MIKEALNYIKFGKIYNSIEIADHQASGMISYVLSKFSKSKSGLVLLNSHIENKVESLKPFIKNTEPVFLVLNTSQVLNKCVEYSQKNDAEIIHQHFPGIDLNDMYYEFNWTSEYGFLSLCRKSVLEDWVQKMENCQINIFDVSLGINSIVATIPYIKTNEVHLYSGKILLASTPPVFVSTQVDSNEKYKLSGILLRSENLLGFSVLLSIFQGVVSSHNFSTLLQTLKHEFYHKIFFLKTSKSFLLLFFLALLFNFLYFNSYYKEAASLEQTLLANNQQLKTLKDTEQSVKNKEEKWKELVGSTQSKSSFYLDQIAATVHNSLQFNSFEFQPLEKKVEPEKEIEFSKGQIHISGTTESNEAFTAWLQRLQSLDGIESHEIMRFIFHEQTKAYQFILVLKIK